MPPSTILAPEDLSAARSEQTTYFRNGEEAESLWDSASSSMAPHLEPFTNSFELLSAGQVLSARIVLSRRRTEDFRHMERGVEDALQQSHRPATNAGAFVGATSWSRRGEPASGWHDHRLPDPVSAIVPSVTSAVIKGDFGGYCSPVAARSAASPWSLPGQFRLRASRPARRTTDRRTKHAIMASSA